MANYKINKIKYENDIYKIKFSNNYISPSTPQNGNMGDLWWKVEPTLEDEAYAVFNSIDGSLTIFRSTPGKYYNEQVIGSHTYYTGIEDITGDTEPKWIEAYPVKKVIIENTFRPKTAYRLFAFMRKLTEIEGMENLDTSECTNMASMFGGCEELTSINLSHFDTSKVVNMGSMFMYCQKLTSLDLSGFDTSKVTNMKQMFFWCFKLTATLNIMKMPLDYEYMCSYASTSGQLTLKYIAPVTSADIDILVATGSDGHVINGGPA